MRTLLAGFRDSIESQYNSDAIVIFATVTHDDIDNLYFNSDIIDYVYEGNTYIGAAFSIQIVTDDEQPPQAKVAIHNVDQVIGETVRALSNSPQIKIEMFAKSDFTDDNPRVPVGTPTVEYSAPFLFLRNVRCDDISLSADLAGTDFSTEPYPAIRATADRLPGLFVR